MSNGLIILLSFALYIVMVVTVVGVSWYVEKLDPSNELPASIWDEILPPQARSKSRPQSRPHPSRLPAGVGAFSS